MEMWWLIGIALQTTKAVVTGSTPASLTVEKRYMYVYTFTLYSSQILYSKNSIGTQ